MTFGNNTLNNFIWFFLLSLRRIPSSYSIFPDTKEIEFGVNVFWICYHYESKRSKKFWNFHNCGLWCGLRQIWVLPSPVGWYFKIKLRHWFKTLETIYLHELLCSKIKKNPVSVPGVTKNYTSVYPLKFEKKSLRNAIHIESILKFIVHLSLRRQ